jgi:uncharacterized phage-associated protein
MIFRTNQAKSASAVIKDSQSGCVLGKYAVYNQNLHEEAFFSKSTDIIYTNIIMLITHEREKLLNAIIFFASNTHFLGKTKLFKLLFFLDFEHFKDTGRSVTGMDYFAWPMGPVPKSLATEIENPEADMLSKIQFLKVPAGNAFRLSVTPLAKFDATHFSKRELRIMSKLAEEFKTTRANDMVEATHLENQPWHKVYVVQDLKQQQIPYDLAVRRQEEVVMQSIAMERVNLFSNNN